MRKAPDMVGFVFGRLTVIALGPSRSGRGGAKWYCQCQCGKQSLVRGDSLRSGKTNSCGCLGIEMASKNGFIHGMTDSRTYASWEHMKTRCDSPSYKHYHYYGGRGISYCQRWNKFENFYADMGDRPEGKSLDRWPDNNGNYEPSNCRWATRSEQQYNRRKPVKKVKLVATTRTTESLN